jgi:hypothetical protein
VRCKFCGIDEGRLHTSICKLSLKRGLPFLSRVSFCNRCGKKNPKFFIVPDEEWEETIKYYYNKTDILCEECYNYVKKVKDKYRQNSKL